MKKLKMCYSNSKHGFFVETGVSSGMTSGLLLMAYEIMRDRMISITPKKRKINGY
jgi:hypothetical protein